MDRIKLYYLTRTVLFGLLGAVLSILDFSFFGWGFLAILFIMIAVVIITELKNRLEYS